MFDLPLEFRLAVCMLVGALAGSLVNFGIYQFSWQPRPISPWGRRPAGLPPRQVADRIPILGWLWLRREADVHGRGFWIRPFLLELLTAAGFAALYAWEIENFRLFAHVFAVPPASPLLQDRLLAPLSPALAHWPLLSHYVLIVLMLMATFIDIDEKTIPDQVTVPGVLIGLALATLCPWSLLPGMTFMLPAMVPQTEFLHLASPGPWPRALNGGVPNHESLWLALTCFWLWCFALLPRTWHGRYGCRRAVRYFFAKIFREPSSLRICGIWISGSLAITGVWWTCGFSWAGLLSSLTGMAAGMVIIWAVRLVGGAVLRKEAMGFGDVTLMAMIGAFTGWQAILIIFFLAPLAGLVVGLLQFLLHRTQVIPYGPFLCLATLVTLVYWSPIWVHLQPAFAVRGLIPITMVACLVVLAVLLGGMQLVKRLIWR